MLGADTLEVVDGIVDVLLALAVRDGAVDSLGDEGRVLAVARAVRVGRAAVRLEGVQAAWEHAGGHGLRRRGCWSGRRAWLDVGRRWGRGQDLVGRHNNAGDARSGESEDRAAARGDDIAGRASRGGRVCGGLSDRGWRHRTGRGGRGERGSELGHGGEHSWRRVACDVGGARGNRRDGLAGRAGRGRGLRNNSDILHWAGWADCVCRVGRDRGRRSVDHRGRAGGVHNRRGGTSRCGCIDHGGGAGSVKDWSGGSRSRRCGWCGGVNHGRWARRIHNWSRGAGWGRGVYNWRGCRGGGGVDNWDDAA